MPVKNRIPKGAPRENPDEGTYPAICVQVIDMGTHASKTEKYGDTHWVQLAFELVDERTKDNKPMVVYRSYNYINTPKSNLSKLLKSWLNVKDPDNFDMEECLGKPAMVTIVHNEHDGNTYANIASITSVPKGTKVRKHSEPLISLFLNENFDEDEFKKLPEFMQSKIAGTEEYRKVTRLNGKATHKVRDRSDEDDDQEDDKPKRGRKPAKRGKSSVGKTVKKTKKAKTKR